MTEKYQSFQGRYAGEIEPPKQSSIKSPNNSPNVLFIVLDDVGYGQLGCYGSDISTPNMDRLAGNGLMYTNFHTTAMCSPTRSSLMTGRNHHSNGMGCITEMSTGFPGYNAVIPRKNGFLSEMLAPRGYACFALGKWHLLPDEETNMGATKENWPLARGFERFYGFLGGHTDEFRPNLVYDNHQIDPPRTVEEGYHLTEDLVDRAIEFITDLKNANSDRPFFMYLAPGAMHAPHQAPAEWIEKYKGRFDQGWEKWRQVVYQRQLETGVIPAGTELPARPEWIQDWETLSKDQKALYARFMEVFAGFLEHTDYHIGRLLYFLESSGQLDNTLIMLVSDNGASSEGGPNGSINESRIYNLAPYTLDENLKVMDQLGGPESYPNYPWGWTWAGNTPLKRWKRETHEGGVADPLIVHWPAGIKSGGEKRRQYVHAIDLAPTVLEELSLVPPAVINGVDQSPLQGTSFSYTLNQADAEDRHLTQYYEMMGCRAIYHWGWKAVTWHRIHIPIPGMEHKSFDQDIWELYRVAEDFSESRDLAQKYPEKLRQLIDIWWAEAGRYQVLPLDDRGSQRFLAPRQKPYGDRKRFVYYPFGAAIGEGGAVDLKNRSHTITAEVDIPDKNTEGVLLAHGGLHGGYSFFLKDHRLWYVYNFLGMESTTLVSNRDIPIGSNKLIFQFIKKEERVLGPAGTGRLFVNDQLVGEGEIPRTIGVRIHLANDGLCCGYDGETPVSREYVSPFRFNGMLKRVIVDVEGEPLFDPDLEYRMALARQ
ncbi:MAG: arylsulfatase [Deltaproteobacteria bacterium]|nr:arylsulfatase [Deltaproteobacteria bacterium]